ncbi:MAG: hypothetical protein LBR48_04690 [Dysgonamonadaceae bacterium]|jgi:TonB-dependent SusC/RagA subfamily outer membrane receptor|nr:hypothetical protein [Dysgonamonadaceae bacterium]
METFLFYLLRASVCTALFYGFYKLCLSRTTFHAANRLLLMCILLLIIVLPLFRYHLLPQSEAEGIILLVQPSEIALDKAIQASTAPEIPWLHLLTIVYFVGLTSVFVRYVYGVCQIRRIIASSERRRLPGNFDLCISDKIVAPFSWMRHIVVSRADFVADSESIVNHEKSHVMQKHSRDRLLFDAFACFFWFNPFSWLLRREIQSIHEFQADAYVLKQGVNVKQYQFLLIRKSAGEHTFALANNFLRRDLHKRIKMMMKHKTNPKRQMTYFVLLPVILLGITVLSMPKLTAGEKMEANRPIDKAKSVASDTIRPINSDSLLYFIDGEEIDRSKLKELSPDQIKSLEVLKDKSAMEIFGERGKNGVVRIWLKKEEDSVSEKAGKRITKRKIINLTPASDSTRSKTNQKVIGDSKRPERRIKGKIVLKDSVAAPKDKKYVTIVVPPKKKEEPVIIRSEGQKPLIICDGKEISEKEMKELSHGDIESISVLKDSTATKIYGEKGKNGVIVFEMKKK